MLFFKEQDTDDKDQDTSDDDEDKVIDTANSQGGVYTD
jgi:hypothetical protein